MVRVHRVVHDETGREKTGWRYRFEPSAGGTAFTESFEFQWRPLGNPAVELFVPRGPPGQPRYPRNAAADRAAAEAGGAGGRCAVDRAPLGT
jgi:hypothetical protein